MGFVSKVKFVLRGTLNAYRICSVLNDKKGELSRHEGEIIRYTHSLEKGLSLENVRPFFGYEKIMEGYSHVKKYLDLGGDGERPNMFLSALTQYLEYHDNKGLTSAKLEKVRKIFEELSNRIGSNLKSGGILTMQKPNYSVEEQKCFAKLFNDRHSVREFAHTPVDQDKLYEAIEMAMRCPSACNRQCYRCYILTKNSFKSLGDLSGIGGFADDAEQFLLITGRMSDYRLSENMQWIVTGTVFASYLTLALQAKGIASCFVQRPVLPSKWLYRIWKKLDINKDEQMICLIAIGNFKDEYNVPISHRLTFNKIVKKIDYADRHQEE